PRIFVCAAGKPGPPTPSTGLPMFGWRRSHRRGTLGPVSFQALYRKYRSQSFGELVGQEPVATALRNAVRDDRGRHAYLFTGPRGTGKTSTARILAKALNCEHPTPEGEPDNTCESCVAIT